MLVFVVLFYTGTVIVVFLTLPCAEAYTDLGRLELCPVKAQPTGTVYDVLDVDAA
jgi:hypothetical protein